jgi:hypothetical protein
MCDLLYNLAARVLVVLEAVSVIAIVDCVIFSSVGPGPLPFDYCQEALSLILQRRNSVDS